MEKLQEIQQAVQKRIQDKTEQITSKISDIKYIDIDGNTYIYLIDEKNNIFKAKASAHEEMLLLEKGDTVELTCNGSKIISCTKK